MSIIAGLGVRQAKGGTQAQVQRRRAREEADDHVRPHLLQSIRGTAHEQLQLEEDFQVIFNIMRFLLFPTQMKLIGNILELHL